MTADKSKLKTLNKLTDEGFDTEKKITSIDMKIAYDHGLSGEIGVILELQESSPTFATQWTMRNRNPQRPIAVTLTKRRMTAVKTMKDTNTADTAVISKMEELRKLVNDLEDGTVISIRIEEVMILAEEE